MSRRKSRRSTTPKLSEALGWNVVERRNYGFLWARDMGAEIVAVVDDDNVPLDNWGEQIFVGKEIEVDYYETDLLAFDPIAVTGTQPPLAPGIPAAAARRARFR